MGKLEQRSDGYYILDLRVGCISIKKAFQDADKPLDEISKNAKPDGFCVNIPDIKNN